jgi:hypothetical protein
MIAAMTQRAVDVGVVLGMPKWRATLRLTTRKK